MRTPVRTPRSSSKQGGDWRDAPLAVAVTSMPMSYVSSAHIVSPVSSEASTHHVGEERVLFGRASIMILHRRSDVDACPNAREVEQADGRGASGETRCHCRPRPLRRRAVCYWQAMCLHISPPASSGRPGTMSARGRGSLHPFRHPSEPSLS